MKRNKVNRRAVLCSKKVAPYIFTLPYVLSIAVFVIGSVITLFEMSLFDIGNLGARFVGFSNYRRLLRDEVFYKTIMNGLSNSLTLLATILPLALFLAIIMSLAGRKYWKGMESTISGYGKESSEIECDISAENYIISVKNTIYVRLLIPMTVSISAVSIFIRQLIAIFGIDKYVSMTALPIVICVFRWTGVITLVFYEHIRKIDLEIYEAAMLDGASKAGVYVKIVLPEIRRTIGLAILGLFMRGMIMFMEPYVVWNGNDSPYNSSLTIIGYIFRRGIQKNDMGYASAIGGLVIVIGAAIYIVFKIVIFMKYKLKASIE